MADAERVSKLSLLSTSSTSTVEQPESPRVVRMIESHARPLRCVAVGGYPPPSIEVHVGSRDVSLDFKFSSALLLASGVRGLRHISVQSERWNNEFDVTADDDGTVVKCVAAVPGLKPTVQAIRLHVDCELLLLPVSSVASPEFCSRWGTGAWRTGSEVRGDKVIQK